MFAPTDQAFFDHFTEEEWSALEDEEERLTMLLRRHIVPGQIPEKMVREGRVESLRPLATGEARPRTYGVEVEDGQLRIAGQATVLKRLEASNGTIYVVSEPILELDREPQRTPSTGTPAGPPVR